MAFVDVETILNITQISEDSYEDEQLDEFISFAQKEVLARIQQRVNREEVRYLDYTRQNNIDGNNKKFYLARWEGHFLGDLDYNGKIDEKDIKVLSIDNNGKESILEVASVSHDEMSFVLSEAPKGVRMFVTYNLSPLDLVTPDPLVSLVTAYLASSYLSMTDGSDESFRIGNVSFGGNHRGITGNKFYKKYEELMATLFDSIGGGAIWGESLVRI